MPLLKKVKDNRELREWRRMTQIPLATFAHIRVHSRYISIRVISVSQKKRPVKRLRHSTGRDKLQFPSTRLRALSSNIHDIVLKHRQRHARQFLADLQVNHRGPLHSLFGPGQLGNEINVGLNLGLEFIDADD